MGKKGVPAIYDVNRLIQLGINPENGLPYKYETEEVSKLGIKSTLRVLDRQDAVNRYKWYNLPKGLDGRLIERILYYRYQGAFFYLKNLNRFFFLPFANNGSPDCYGRYTGIIPLNFGGGSTTADKDTEKEFIKGLEFKPVYDIVLDEEFTPEMFESSCVILKDYTNDYAQYNTPRVNLQEPLLDVMSNCIPYMNTALINSTGVDGMRVNDQDQYTNVELANRSVNNAALNGKAWVPVVGPIEFQQLTSGATGKAEEFLMAMQGLDNYRLSLYGLKNGGVFTKKSHMLQDEQDTNMGNVGLVNDDGLSLRKEFCDIVNSIWNLGVSVESNETILNTDTDMNGYIGSDNYNLDEVDTTDIGGDEDE